MAKDQTQIYVNNIERTLQNDYHYLKDTIEDFRNMCQRITPEKNIPSGIVADIREIYKEIQNRLSEIKGIQQLLKGKYRQFAKKDPLRDKEILEIAFIAKNCYSKFQYVQMQKQAIQRAKGLVEKEPFRAIHHTFPLQWFHSKENQERFMKNLGFLEEQEEKISIDEKAEEREERLQEKPEAITLFIFSGEEKHLDSLQSQIQLRKYDIMERFDRDEIRGVMSHLREIDLSELEKMIQPLMEISGCPMVKGLLLPIHSQKDIERDLLGLVKITLKELKEGEVRTILI
jgi:hypothetical protein